MLICPAIDLYQGKAVRLYKGDYSQMTVYSHDPAAISEKFAQAGASHMHIVDLAGAKNGTTPNYEPILEIKRRGGLFCDVGGGIRSMETIERYVSAGIDRVILGTAAVTQPGFLEEAAKAYGSKIAVGMDLKDGYVAIKGWTEQSALTPWEFCEKLQKIGIETIICTDISRDGAMKGTNHDLYRELRDRFSMNIIASGGVSSMEDVEKLAWAKLYGAIIVKAYYTGAIDLARAIEVAT